MCAYVDRLDQAGALVAPGETQDPQVVIDVDVKPYVKPRGWEKKKNRVRPKRYAQ